MNLLRRILAPIESRHVVLLLACFAVSCAGVGTAYWLAYELGGCLR